MAEKKITDLNKIEDKEEVRKRYEELKKHKKVVATSGFFDPLHFGHVEYLEKAKELGDWLIVIVDNDKQTMLKKGFVFMPAEERIKIIRQLKPVDEVFLSIDEDSTVCKSLEKIKPNIFAKGGDRYSYEIPESKVCRENNIQIIDGLGAKVQSSSELVKKAGEAQDKINENPELKRVKTL